MLLLFFFPVGFYSDFLKDFVLSILRTLPRAFSRQMAEVNCHHNANECRWLHFNVSVLCLEKNESDCQ